MANGFLERAGIVGWGKIEAALLAALAADEAILLIGSHGSNKTEGAAALAKSVLGVHTSFRKYDTPIINMDDLLGILDPNSIKNGKVDFLQTASSIWLVDACLFDELNRASAFVQSKLFELIRDRSVMGMRTRLKLVLSAVNPPAKYQSGYMDLALASRFSCFDIPDSEALTEGEKLDILLKGNERRVVDTDGAFELQRAIEQVKITKFGEEDAKYAANVVVKIQKELSNKGVMWSMRQARSCLKMLMVLEAFKVTGFFSPSPDDLLTVVLALVPEVHGITRANVDRAGIITTLSALLVGFQLQDPIVIARNIDELIEADVKDPLAWTAAVVTSIGNETSISKLNDCIKVVKKRASSGNIELDPAQKVIKNLAIRKIILETSKSDGLFTLSELENKLNDIKSA